MLIIKKMKIFKKWSLCIIMKILKIKRVIIRNKKILKKSRMMKIQKKSDNNIENNGEERRRN